MTISTEVGAAKPDSKIFAVALQKCNCELEEVVHIGDNLNADYRGAINVGIKAFLLKRNGVSQPEVNQFATLLDCCNYQFTEGVLPPMVLDFDAVLVIVYYDSITKMKVLLNREKYLYNKDMDGRSLQKVDVDSINLLSIEQIFFSMNSVIGVRKK